VLSKTVDLVAREWGADEMLQDIGHRETADMALHNESPGLHFLEVP